jgi:hypothetical protein
LTGAVTNLENRRSVTLQRLLNASDQVLADKRQRIVSTPIQGEGQQALHIFRTELN